MTPRSQPEWIGRTPETMPTQAVFIRLAEKQDWICACGCGQTMVPQRDKIVRDHKIPLRDGGENRERNLQLMLEAHHLLKTGKENMERAIGNSWKAKAFPELKERKRSGFQTNRNSPYRKKMNGEIVPR